MSRDTRGSVIVVDNAPTVTGLGYCADANETARVADNFSLVSTASISGIRFWGNYFWSGVGFPSQNLPTDSFTMNVYADNGGQVGALLATRSLLATRTEISRWAKYSYSANFADVDLDGGTTYWLSLSDATGGNTNRLWYWLASQQDGDICWQSFDAGATWTVHEYDNLAFQLLAVPEPAAGIFVVAALAAARRRRR